MNGQLQAAEAEMEAYKHEKQRRLNDFNIAVPLKLHQVMECTSYDDYDACLTICFIVCAKEIYTC